MEWGESEWDRRLCSRVRHVCVEWGAWEQEGSVTATE